MNASEYPIYRLTGERITDPAQVQQGDLVRVRCDDGIERVGAIGFDRLGDWILFPAAVLAQAVPLRGDKRPRRMKGAMPM